MSLSRKKPFSQQKQKEKQEKLQQRAEWNAANPEVREVAEKFVLANCYDPNYVAENYYPDFDVTREIGNNYF